MLGGANDYDGMIEQRPLLGEGRPPDVDDLRRAVRLSATTSYLLGVTSLAYAWRAVVSKVENAAQRRPRCELPQR